MNPPTKLSKMTRFTYLSRKEMAGFRIPHEHISVGPETVYDGSKQMYLIRVDRKVMRKYSEAFMNLYNVLDLPEMESDKIRLALLGF